MLESWHAGDVILDLYEVKEVYWPGAQGLVYRVRHREWDVDLAVKSPRETAFETQAETESFVEVADAWVGLGLFPHIVSCYYVRKLGGIPRLFLEFVEGGSLHDWIDTRKLYEGGPHESLKRMLDVAIQFAWGLQYAHENGVFHLDVKPGNLLLTNEGVAKVKGFGLAFSTRSPATEERKEPWQKTDIWSWAVCLLHMFTGASHWQDEEYIEGALDAYLDRSASDEDIPAMPPGIAELLKRCLQNDPHQRPESMSEIAESLRRIYQEEIGVAHSRRRPIQAHAQAESLNNRALSLLDLGRAEEALWIWDEALELKPQHVEATFNSGLMRWRMARISDDELVRSLEALKHSDTREGFINYLLSQVHQERDDGQAALEALENSEGALADNDNLTEAISIRRLGLQSERPLAAFLDDEIQGPNVFTPDGKSLLLTVSGFRVRILDFDRPLSPRYLAGHTGAIHAISVSANGRFALTSSQDSTVRLWDLETTKCLRTINDELPHTTRLALSGDGRYAVFATDCWSREDTHKSVLRLWDVKEGSQIRDFEVPINDYGFPPVILAVAISPDAKYVLTGGEGESHLWDAATGKRLHELSGIWGYLWFVSFNSEGTKCFATNSHSVAEFDPATGSCLKLTKLVEPTDDRRSRVVVSADGDFALYGSEYGELKLWEIATQRCLRTFLDLTDQAWWEVSRSRGIESVNLGPDGKYSLSENKSGVYKLWRCRREFHAPLILSRITATEEAIGSQLAAEEHLAIARAAIAEERYVDAANSIRAARAIPGLERSAEAFELWCSLYSRLPRREIKATWRSHAFKGPEFGTVTSISADGKYALFGTYNYELYDVATGECLRVFDGAIHGRPALSGDAKVLMIGGWECFEAWDAVRRERISKIFSCHELHVDATAISLDGKFAATCTDKVLNLWEINTQDGLRYLRSITTDWGDLSALAFSSDNRYCVSGTGLSPKERDCRLRLWEIPSGKLAKIFAENEDGIYTVVFTPDNKYVLSAGYDDTLKLWNVETGRCVRSFEGHTQSVYKLDISMDGRFALSASIDHTMRLWDLLTGECLRTWEIHADFIGPVRFSTDCRYIIAGVGYECRVEVLDWELEDRDVADWDEGARPYLANFIARHKDDFGRKVPAWSEEEFQDLLNQVGGGGYGWLRSEGISRELEKMAHAITPNVKLLPARFSRAVDALNPAVQEIPAKVRLWTDEYIRSRARKSVPAAIHYTQPYTEADWTGAVSFGQLPEQPTVFSRNQKLVASCIGDTLKVWNATTGEGLHDLTASSARLVCANFSPDGRLVSTSAMKDAITVWELAEGTCVATLPDKNTRHDSICFSADGSMLAAGCRDGMVKIWSTDACECVFSRRAHDHSVETVDVSLDQRLVATGSEREIKVWDIVTGDCLEVISDRVPGLRKICFSPDGNFIASSCEEKFNSADNEISLWDTRSGRLINTFKGHLDIVMSFAFSPVGPYLVSAAADGSVRLWDINSGGCICVLDARLGDLGRSSNRYAQRVVFSPDGKQILFCRGYRNWFERAVWTIDWEA